MWGQVWNLPTNLGKLQTCPHMVYGSNRGNKALLQPREVLFRTHDRRDDRFFARPEQQRRLEGIPAAGIGPATQEPLVEALHGNLWSVLLPLQRSAHVRRTCHATDNRSARQAGSRLSGSP